MDMHRAHHGYERECPGYNHPDNTGTSFKPEGNMGEIIAGALTGVVLYQVIKTAIKRILSR